MPFFAPRKLSLSLMILFLSMCTSAVCGAQDLSSNYLWQPVRIGAGGWMRGMAVSPSDATRRYARGDVDNVYRWDEATQQWYPTKISSALPANITAAPASAGGGAIAIDPQNPDHVLVVYTFNRSGDLAATNPSLALNVYRSTDGGKTYQAGNLSLQGDLSQETSGERLAIDPNNGQVAYLGSPGAAGATDGLFRSVDGGATWTLVSGGGYPANTASVRYEAQLPRFDGGSGTGSANGVTATKTIYVTYIKHDETNNDAATGGGVLKSADGGLTWTDVSLADAELYFATVDAGGNLWTSDGSTKIYRYSRAGAWTASVTPHGGGSGIAVDASNAKRIFVTSGGGTLARSLDGGVTWTDLGGNLTFSSTQTIEWLRPSSYRPQGHYVSVSGLYLDPAGRLFLAGANDGILTTMPDDATDSLANPPVWSSSSVGIEEMVAQPGVIPPGGKPVLTVEDETLFTINDPDTFTAQHYTIDLWNGNNGLASGTDISYAPNQPQYIAVLSNNLTAGNPVAHTSEYSGYSADGGNSWTVFPSITSGTHPCILYGGSMAVSARAKGHEGDAPGGDNLVWIPSNFNDFSLFAHGPAPFYSTDGGATWTQTASFNNASGAQPVTSPCSSGPTSYTYMGYQWGPWIFSLTQHLLVADPVTPGTFYADLDAGGFWKSTDGGVTWSQAATNGSPEASNGAPGFPQHGQMAAVPGVSGEMWLVDGSDGASEHGLYHTTNGGSSFTRNGNFDFAWTLALGKAASGSAYPAVYVYGRHVGDPQWGVFQSIDGGATFQRISFYPDGIIDMPNSMTASWDVFGTVYLGFGGNSWYYGKFYAPTIVPGAPALSATAADGAVNLSWFVSSNGGTPSGFSIYRGTAAGGESATAIATNIDATTYTDTGLTDGTKYFYYITASNSIGTSPRSNEVSATPAVQPPPASASLVAFPGDGQVELSFAAVAGATSYNIYRSSTAGAEGATPAATTTATSYLDTGLTNGSVYYYVVRAVNTAGPGAVSAEARGAPVAATATVAQIAHATTAPALDGTVSSIWNTTATYPLNHLTGAIPSGQSNSATWQGLWDSKNLYVLVNVLDSTVIANSDSVEIYIDGNNGKAFSYTALDWQYVLGYGANSVQEYSNGSMGSNTAGVSYGQAAIPGGYRIVAAIPWATLGVTPASKDFIGIDVALNNFYVAGTRANKLFWNSTTDTDYNDPSLFGTGELLVGAAQAQTQAPVFTPAPGSYTSAQSIHIASATPGATIRYTTDGSTPSATNGTIYTAPFTLSTTTQVSAIASVAGDLDSPVATATYTINIPVVTAAPTVSPAGGAYASPVSVTLASATAGAVIRYTTDGSTPSDTAGTVYTAPFTVSATATVKAIAYAAGDVDSAVVSTSYAIGDSTALPAGWTDLDIGAPAVAGSASYSNGVWTVSGGGTDLDNHADQFNLASKAAGGDTTIVAKLTAVTDTRGWAKSGVMLRATTASGSIYAGVFATPIHGVVFLWRSVSDGLTYLSQVPSVASPTLENPVWLKVVKTDATYTGFYSLDGQTYLPVGGPVVLQFPAATYVAGLAVTAHDPALVNTSDFSSVSVVSKQSKLATPTFAPAAGTYDAPETITITSATAGAQIRYTVDGTTPTATAGAVYSKPFVVASATVVRAVAYLPGEITSATGVARYSFQLPTGWSEDDIGIPATDGSASEINGVWTVAAGGEGIGGASDQFGFPNEAVSGDASISAEITSFTDTSAVAQGGLMFRDTMDAAAANVAILATEANGLMLEWRTAKGARAQSAKLLGVPAPAPAKPLWLKLSRAGDSFTGYYSIDGISYDQAGPTVEVVLPSSPSLAGLAVAADTASGLNTVVFRHVTLTEPQVQVAYPTFSVPGGVYTTAQTITVSSSTAGASIRYTTDGSTPTATAGTLYTGPITLAASATLKAVAFATGEVLSSVSSASYTIVAQTLPSGTYEIVNRNSNQSLNDYAFGVTPGSAIHQYTTQAAANAEFVVSPNTDGYYSITEVSGFGLFLGVGGLTTVGSPVDVETGNSSAGQEWLLEPTDSGFYKVVNRLSGLVLDVSGSSTDLGAAIIESADSGAQSQQWQFVKP